MDDRFQGLMKSLRAMAADTTLELHDRLLGAEKAINEYIQRLRGAARQSTLKRLREAVRTEEQPNVFWRTVEDIISQLLGP